jgi:4-hydroxy-tetrahydrodipicolinate synthase
MSLGGIGAISVLSNILPAETVAICDRFFAGDIKGSAALQCRYHALITALFSEVNPIPVKAGLNMQGFNVGSPRLPLVEMTDAGKERLRKAMVEFGVL